MKRYITWILLIVMLLGTFSSCKKKDTTVSGSQVDPNSVNINDTLTQEESVPSDSFDSSCVLNALISGQIAGSAAEGANQSLSYEATLTGTITKINTAYDAKRGDITITMVISGGEESSIICYCMTGAGVDKIGIGDTITVRGYIVNRSDDYGGSTIAFDTGCILVSYQKHNKAAPTNPVDIVKAAYALSAGAQLPYKATLTGAITKVNVPYSPAYKNITVTIAVCGAENMPIKCYRLKGNSADKIGVGDTITVAGYIEKYKHATGSTEVEFVADCQLVSWSDTGTDTPAVSDKPVNSNTTQIDAGDAATKPSAGSAYVLVFESNGTKRYFNGKTESQSATYRLATTTNLEDAVSVKLQAVSGGYAMYFMDGDKKTYIRMYELDAINGKGSLELVSTVPDEVLTFDTTFYTFVYKSSSANRYYLGAYSAYTTLRVCNLSYMSADNVGVSYYPARLYTHSEPTPTTPAKPVTPTTPAVPETTPPSEPATESTTPSTPTTKPTVPSGSDDNTQTDPTETTIPETEPIPSRPVVLAAFTFPNGTSGAHDDGDDSGYDGYTCTSGGYVLRFANYSKLTFGGHDQMGNGFVKFGSSNAVGTVTFQVPENVTKVELHLAKYKAKTSKCSINGGVEIDLTKSCNYGEFDVVTIDTSVNKTVTISTVSSAPRMVMYAVIYHG